MKKAFYFLIFSATALFLFSLTSQALAAEIILKKGRTLQAKVVEITPKNIKLDIEGVELTYAFDEIQSVNGIEDFNQAKLTELSKLGHEYIDQKKSAEALAIFKKIEELDPSDSHIVSGLSKALCGLKQHPESIPYILKEIKMNPDNANAHSRLGNAYRHNHDPEMVKKALTEYEKAIELEGPTAANQFDLGLTYRVANEEDKAASCFEEAIKLGPAKSRYFMNLGYSYLSLGKNQEAIAALQTILDKFNDHHANAYNGLSKAYAALGQSAKAAEYERKAKESGYRPRNCKTCFQF